MKSIAIFKKSTIGRISSLGSAVFLLIVLNACSSGVDEDVKKKAITAKSGKVLMEKNCFSCHNTQNSDNMLAPPMQRVKDHYLDDETSRDEFVKAIVEWCKNPAEDKSRMPGARRKFGLMPKQNFDLSEVETIAGFLYENDIDFSCATE